MSTFYGVFMFNYSQCEKVTSSYSGIRMKSAREQMGDEAAINAWMDG